MIPLPESTTSKSLQVGVKDGFIVLGVNDQPFAKFSPEQATALGCLLIQRAVSVLCGSQMVTDIADEIAKETETTS